MTFDTGSTLPTTSIMLQLPTFREGSGLRQTHYDVTVGCLRRTSLVSIAALRSLLLAFAAAHWHTARTT